MFDRHYHPAAGPSHVSVDVTEHRAPTADSARLLREVEAAARDAVQSAIRVSETPVEIVLHQYADVLNAQDRYAMTYKLGTWKRTVQHRQDMGKTREETIHALVDTLAKDIAKGLVGIMLKNGGRI